MWWAHGALHLEPTLISVFDRGFTQGDGVFETIRITGGQPVRLGAHLDRFRRGAIQIGFEPPDMSEVRRAVAELTHVASEPHGFIRVTLSSGPSVEPFADAEPFMVAAWRGGRPQTNPARTLTPPWSRTTPTALRGVKSTSYGESAMTMRWARQHGADEALMATPEGRLCEGASSNVFVVIDGTLLTPSTESGCLPGVTRGALLAAGYGTPSELSWPAQHHISEAFLVSAGRDCQPIATIDEKPLPVIDGDITRRARETLAEGE
jgi:branched-chain amino acid aminotransferase